jgi:phosphatidate cytidylyltransferase
VSNDNRGNDNRGSDNTNDPTIDFGDEFGVVRFGSDDDSGPALSFGSNETEQLPHWTEPATGEIPRFMKQDTESARRPEQDDDETDVWSAYNDPSAPARKPPIDLTGDGPRRFETTTPPPVERPRREGRIVIGTDPTGETRRQAPLRDASGAQTRPTQVTRAGRTSPASRPGQPRVAGRAGATGSMSRPPVSGARDLPTATAVGALLLAVFIGALIVGPAAVMVIVLAVIGLAAFEFFTQITQAGYKPISVIGIVSCIAAPAVAYWKGDSAIPLVLLFAFVGISLVFVASDGVDSGPVPNSAATMIAIIWIGLMGSYAGLILRWSTLGEGFAQRGTDTLFIIVAGVVANDIAAYFVGTAVGRQPLREWISPKKSIEGLIGGTIGTFVVVVLVGLQSTTWPSFGSWIMLSLVISVMAPLGDLTESMFKRNLDIKDFGTVLSGHGGALDRFDSILFVLPAVYYLGMVTTPWA